MDTRLYRRLFRCYPAGNGGNVLSGYTGFMEIYLIRHTTPLIEKGICYGQSDIPLADSFESEWEIIRQQLPKEMDCIYTSPLKRCWQLARKLEQHYQVPLFTDKRLMEMHFG